MKRSLRSWLWRVPIDQEVDEEIAFHIEMRTRELVDKGLDPGIARTMVRARLGDAARLKRTCVDLGRRRDREMRLTRWLEEFRDDVRFALRQLKMSPGFTLVATITLALGIGANSAMFALADAALVRPLPYPEPDRLVALSEIRQGQPGSAVNPVDFVEWSERTRSFTAIAAVVRGGGSLVGDDGVAEPVPGQAVTSRFFDVLGVKPIAGRTFRDDDEGPVSDVVVLSEGFWRRRFGADPSLVGRAARLSGRTFTVIGIVPADFQFELPGTTSEAPSMMWTLLNRPEDRGPAQRYPHYLQVIGRLKDGVTLNTARADIAGVADAIAREMPGTNKGHAATASPLRERIIRSELRLTSILLLGVVGLVLLMCCANVANLLLARASARSREFAIRSALGAGRRRIVRQVLTESLVLAILGGLTGAAFGATIVRAAPSLIPPDLIPGVVTVSFDGRVLTFCALAALVVAVLYGLSPAWHIARMPPVQAMTNDGRSVTGSSARFRRALAVSQVAIAVFLLCGAGLLLRSLLALESVDSGSRTGDVLTMIVGAGSGADTSPASMWRKYQAYQREVEQVPGVRSVAWGGALPFGGMWYDQNFQIDGDQPRPPADRDGAGYQIVSPSFLPLLGVAVLEGRGLTKGDTAESPQVCLVDEEFVRRYLRGRPVLGTRISINAMVQPPQAVTREIVGVVGQVKERPDEPQPRPHVYVPLAQNPWWSATLVVQPIDGPAEALTSGVRAALARVDREQPATRIRTLSAIGAEATARPRFRAVLIGTFASLALVLAMVGVFGVLAYSVQQRTREFGVRIALGASATNLLGLVLGNAARVIGTGVVIGLMCAFAFAQSVASFLFGVQPRDPVTFGSAGLVLLLTAMVACAVPALRAVRVDPVVAFRSE
ncbi:MAG TPA: ABC transporter permease [Gemmatimonadales bacterium]|nr:ABC transporter permease [Gemmatimonadales bacterium]